MVIDKKGPKRAVYWYSKTIFMVFFSIIMFFVLFLALPSFLYLFIENSGVVYIISAILSIVITVLFAIYYNKKFVKEWKPTGNQKVVDKTSSRIATVFVVLVVIYIILGFLTKSTILKTSGNIIFPIIFLAYIYFKFLKKKI
ncbi:MAG: hypothetical protein KJ674_05410 [Nanoarchaeota archaeon]|nr:hypothetical protein [Nanoarchaeota archaeon]